MEQTIYTTSQITRTPLSFAHMKLFTDTIIEVEQQIQKEILAYEN